jgi:hypothetical protein
MIEAVVTLGIAILSYLFYIERRISKLEAKICLIIKILNKNNESENT